MGSEVLISTLSDLTLPLQPNGRVPNLVFPESTSERIVLVYQHLAAGHPGAGYWLKPRAENLWIVLQGELETVIGGVRYRVTAGECLYQPENVARSTSNPGNVDLFGIEIYVPLRGESVEVPAPPAVIEAEEAKDTGVRVQSLSDLKSPVGPEGRVPHLIFPEDTSPRIVMVYQRIAPGVMSGYFSRPRAENLWVVLEGQLETVIGGKRYFVNAGQVLYQPQNVPRAVGNRGSVDMFGIEIYVPIRGEYIEAPWPEEIVDA
jgi:mannose-6-phosphate isomerase-like protein (cupin superfamily)